MDDGPRRFPAAPAPSPSCTRCGHRLPLGSTLCPHCLLAAGLDAPPPEFTTTAATAAPRSSGPVAPDDAIDATTTTESVAADAWVAGKYRIVAEIGRGGMGIVYQARQEDLSRLVALKRLAGTLADTDHARLRFFREAEAAARLRHPGLVTILEWGEDQGRPFLVMEYIGGPSLASHLKEHGPVEPRLAATWMQQVADAVEHAHQNGIIHRDLKPANILLTPEGLPKVTDFGLAKELDADIELTRAGDLVGTAGFMAPEQVSSRWGTLSARTDVYAIGATLYCLLTGRAPFAAASAPETVHQVVTRDPIPPRALNSEVPRDLDTICLRCLEKSPDRRYPSAAALASELTRWLTGHPIEARPIGPAERAWKWTRRNPLAAVLTAAVALSLTVGFATTLWQLFRAEEAGRRLRLELQRSTFALANSRRDEETDADFLVRLARQLRDDPSSRPLATLILDHLSRHQVALPWAGPFTNWQAVQEFFLDPEGRWIGIGATPTDGVIVTALVDGKPIAAVAPGGTTLLRSCRKPVYPLAVSDDGRWVATFNLPTPVLINVQTRANLLLDQISDVRRLAFNRQGSRVVAVCGDTSVHVLETQTGRIVRSLPQHSQRICDARFGPDGSLVYTLAEAVRIWNAETGSPIGPAQPPRMINVTAAAINGDGTRLATVSSDGRVALFDARSGDPTGIVCEHPGAHDLEISRDGMTLLSLGVTTVRVWRADTGDPIGPELSHAREIHSARFSPDGSAIATAGEDGVVRIWHRRGNRFEVSPIFLPTFAHSADFSPDGRRIATLDKLGTAWIWDAVPGAARPLSLPGPLDAKFARFVPGDESVMVISRSGAARLFDSRTGSSIRTLLDTNRPISLVRFSPDERWMALGGLDGRCWLVDRVSDTEHELPMTPGGAVTELRFNRPGTRVFMATGKRNGRIWELTANRAIAELPGPIERRPQDSILQAEFTPDGEGVVWGALDGSLLLWEYGRSSEPATLHTFSGPVWDCTFNPAGDRLVAVSMDRSAILLSWPDGAAASLPLKHDGEIVSAAFSPDGQRLLTCSFDRTVRVWDGRTGGGRELPWRHTDRVDRAAFSPDGTRVAVAGWDGRVTLWNVALGLPSAEPLVHPERVMSVEFDAAGQRLLTVDAGGSVRIWDIPSPPGPAPDWLAELVEALAGRRQHSDGRIEDIPPTELARLRARFSTAPNTEADLYTRWAHWFFSDRLNRPPSFLSARQDSQAPALTMPGP